MENILVSACLLGIGCRYDGKHKADPEVLKLKERYNLIPVCPEIFGGLPTPRVPSERIGDKVMMKDGRDVTENYQKGAEEASVAAMLGLSIPEKKKQPAFLVACGVFLVAAAGVLAHMIVKLAGYCKADAVVEEEWTEEEWAAEEAMWPADEDLVTGSDSDVTDDDFEKAE